MGTLVPMNSLLLPQLMGIFISSPRPLTFIFRPDLSINEGVYGTLFDFLVEFQFEAIGQ